MPVPLVNPYCTEAQIRAELKDSAAVVNSDLICKAINAASRGIDDICSGDVPNTRRFWKDTTLNTRTYSVEHPTFAYIDDIAERAGVVVKTDDNDDGVYETTWTVGVDYALWPLNADANGLAQPLAFWKIVAVGEKRFPIYERRAGVQVTAKYGWPGIPTQIEEACILRTIGLLLRKDSPLGVLAQGDFGALMIPKFDPDVSALLRPFIKRRPWSISYASDQARTSLFHRRSY
jgi:hypothetical protein